MRLLERKLTTIVYEICEVILKDILTIWKDYQTTKKMIHFFVMTIKQIKKKI